MIIKFPKNDSRPFHVLLIPDSGDSKRLKSAWADADQASDFGQDAARRSFPGQGCEVVVIHTRSREAVRNAFIEGSGKP